MSISLENNKKRRFLCSRGMTFSLEKSETGLILYISFDGYKDPEVIDQVTKGQPVEELLLLWELAHLQSVRILGSNVKLSLFPSIDPGSGWPG